MLPLSVVTPRANGLSTQRHHGSRNETTGHGNNLDRQRKGPKCFYQLAIIGDADEFVGGTGDDFLASQRCAAALDMLPSASTSAPST